MRISPPLPVDAADITVLRRRIGTGEAGVAATRRARIVLLAREGVGPAAIARQLGCSTRTVITWRERYRSGGLAGLNDAPRSGRPVTVDALEVVRRTLRPPSGTGRWSTRTLGAELGISNVAVGNIWRAWGVAPVGAGWVRLATEPALDVPLSAVAGLHVDGAVRVLALLLASPERGDGSGTDDRPVGLDKGADEGLARLARSVGSAPAALLVDGDGGGESLRRWAQWRPTTAVHRVTPAHSWEQLARVASMLVG